MDINDTKLPFTEFTAAYIKDQVEKQKELSKKDLLNRLELSYFKGVTMAEYIETLNIQMKEANSKKDNEWTTNIRYALDQKK